jgi:hypothetical protein
MYIHKFGYWLVFLKKLTRPWGGKLIKLQYNSKFCYSINSIQDKCSTELDICPKDADWQYAKPRNSSPGGQLPHSTILWKKTSRGPTQVRLLFYRPGNSAPDIEEWSSDDGGCHFNKYTSTSFIGYKTTLELNRCREVVENALFGRAVKYSLDARNMGVEKLTKYCEQAKDFNSVNSRLNGFQDVVECMDFFPQLKNPHFFSGRETSITPIKPAGAIQ